MKNGMTLAQLLDFDALRKEKDFNYSRLRSRISTIVSRAVAEGVLIRIP